MCGREATRGGGRLPPLHLRHLTSGAAHLPLVLPEKSEPGGLTCTQGDWNSQLERPRLSMKRLSSP